ncbi:MAG: aminopeptidase P family protein [Rhodobacteraceae bacterium]|nr:aminopeptidase P family protein [Paracoccaceae bacterium]
MTTNPPRGFAKAEFQKRLKRAQKLMEDAKLCALLLTTEPEIRYFTGFLTRFWESPTRPWFLIVPLHGDPIAVIPAIGAHLMSQTWISDIRTWRAPDYDDDGVGLLHATLVEICAPDVQIGIPDLMESHVRMPLSALRELENQLKPREIVGDKGIVRRLRMIKSKPEIAKMAAACAIAQRAFARVDEIATVGVPLSQVFRRFQALCLEEGADWVPYLAGAAGQNGYGDVISPATDTPLAAGDVLMLDTGLVWDGYFSDFDRNFILGKPTSIYHSAHTKLMEAINAGFAAAKPGAVISDLFHAMNDVVNSGTDGSDAGRLGHGVGMQLTEWPSLIKDDHTLLEPGMVLALEPSVVTGDDTLMVHEENIVITDTGARFLSDFQPNALREL